MAQGQVTDTTRHVIGATTAAATLRKLVRDGDLVGFAADSVASGERLVLATSIAQYTTEVFPGEAWARGKALYLHEPSGLITALETHWPIGWAAEAKAANAVGAVVSLDRPLRRPQQVIAPFAFAFMTTQAAAGDYTLRTFGKNVLLTSCKIVHDGALAPGATTIALGNGTGTNNQVLAAAAASTLDSDKENQITLAAPVVLDKLVMRLAGSSFTAGMLAVIARYDEIG